MGMHATLHLTHTHPYRPGCCEQLNLGCVDCPRPHHQLPRPCACMWAPAGASTAAPTLSVRYQDAASRDVWQPLAPGAARPGTGQSWDYVPGTRNQVLGTALLQEGQSRAEQEQAACAAAAMAAITGTAEGGRRGGEGVGVRGGSGTPGTHCGNGVGRGIAGHLTHNPRPSFTNKHSPHTQSLPLAPFTTAPAESGTSPNNPSPQHPPPPTNFKALRQSVLVNIHAASIAREPGAKTAQDSRGGSGAQPFGRGGRRPGGNQDSLGSKQGARRHSHARSMVGMDAFMSEMDEIAAMIAESEDEEAQALVQGGGYGQPGHSEGPFKGQGPDIGRGGGGYFTGSWSNGAKSASPHPHSPPLTPECGTLAWAKNVVLPKQAALDAVQARPQAAAAAAAAAAAVKPSALLASELRLLRSVARGSSPHKDPHPQPWQGQGQGQGRGGSTSHHLGSQHQCLGPRAATEGGPPAGSWGHPGMAAPTSSPPSPLRGTGTSIGGGGAGASTGGGGAAAFRQQQKRLAALALAYTPPPPMLVLDSDIASSRKVVAELNEARKVGRNS